MDDTTLSKAANLAAMQEFLLGINKPAAWKVPRAKLNSQLIRHWTSKARSMTPAEVAMGGAPADVDETPMKKMVDRIIKHITPATRQGIPARARLPVKRKLTMPPPTPLQSPPFLPLSEQKKTLPKASPAIKKQETKEAGTFVQSFRQRRSETRAQERATESVRGLDRVGLFFLKWVAIRVRAVEEKVG